MVSHNEPLKYRQGHHEIEWYEPDLHELLRYCEIIHRLDLRFSEQPDDKDHGGHSYPKTVCEQEGSEVDTDRTCTDRRAGRF